MKRRNFITSAVAIAAALTFLGSSDKSTPGSSSGILPLTQAPAINEIQDENVIETEYRGKTIRIKESDIVYNNYPTNVNLVEFLYEMELFRLKQAGQKNIDTQSVRKSIQEKFDARLEMYKALNVVPIKDKLAPEINDPLIYPPQPGANGSPYYRSSYEEINPNYNCFTYVVRLMWPDLDLVEDTTWLEYGGFEAIADSLIGEPLYEDLTYSEIEAMDSLKKGDIILYKLKKFNKDGKLVETEVVHASIFVSYSKSGAKIVEGKYGITYAALATLQSSGLVFNDGNSELGELSNNGEVAAYDVLRPKAEDLGMVFANLQEN